MPLNGGGFTDRRYNLTILVVEKRGVVGSPAEGVDNGVNDSEKRDSSDHAPSTSDDKPEHAAAKFNVSIVVKSKLIGGGPRFDRHFYEFDVVVGEVEEKQKHNDGRHDDEGSPSFVGNLSASGGAGRLNFSIISYYSNDGEDREDSSRDDDKSDNTEGFGFRIDSSVGSLDSLTLNPKTKKSRAVFSLRKKKKPS
jgi:hypothetical protein